MAGIAGSYASRSGRSSMQQPQLQRLQCEWKVPASGWCVLSCAESTYEHPMNQQYRQLCQPKRLERLAAVAKAAA
jgi:hypothetical protein